MTRAFAPLLVAALALLATTACDTVPDTEYDREALIDDAKAVAERFKQTDPTMADAFFENSVGYAVFPDVGKGGIGVGGAYGRGVLFEGGEVAGFCDLTQGSIGLQLGGQSYAEIIFFENEHALAEFKNDDLTFAAQTSAVAATAGAGANAEYDEGVAVFTMAEKGLMYEASVGGQSFDFVSMN